MRDGFISKILKSQDLFLSVLERHVIFVIILSWRLR